MKYILCWCCLCVITSTLYSQEDVLRPNGRTSSSVGSATDKTENGSSSSTKSKTPFALGIEGGVGFNFFSQNIPTVSNGNPEQFRNVFGSGSGIGWYLAVVGDYSLSDDIGLQMRVGYQTAPFSNSGQIDEMPLIYVGSGLIVSTKQDVKWEVKDVWYATIGFNLRVNVTKQLNLTVGPILQMLSGTPLQTGTFTILSPDNTFFDLDGDGNTTDDLSKTRTFSAIDDSFTKSRFGLDLAASYKINLNKSWALVPRAGFQYMFTKVANDEVDNNITFASDKVLNTLQLGVGLWYYFN